MPNTTVLEQTVTSVSRPRGSQDGVQVPQLQAAIAPLSHLLLQARPVAWAVLHWDHISSVSSWGGTQTESIYLLTEPLEVGFATSTKMYRTEKAGFYLRTSRPRASGWFVELLCLLFLLLYFLVFCSTFFFYFFLLFFTFLNIQDNPFIFKRGHFGQRRN